MAQEKWITVNGKHILIKEGQSVSDAIKENEKKSFTDSSGKKYSSYKEYAENFFGKKNESEADKNFKLGKEEFNKKYKEKMNLDKIYEQANGDQNKMIEIASRIESEFPSEDAISHGDIEAMVASYLERKGKSTIEEDAIRKLREKQQNESNIRLSPKKIDLEKAKRYAYKFNAGTPQSKEILKHIDSFINQAEHRQSNKISLSDTVKQMKMDIKSLQRSNLLDTNELRDPKLNFYMKAIEYVESLETDNERKNRLFGD